MDTTLLLIVAIVLVLLLGAMTLALWRIANMQRQISTTQQLITDSLQSVSRVQNDIANTQREQSHILNDLLTRMAVQTALVSNNPNA